MGLVTTPIRRTATTGPARPPWEPPRPSAADEAQALDTVEARPFLELPLTRTSDLAAEAPTPVFVREGCRAAFELLVTAGLSPRTRRTWRWGAWSRPKRRC